MSFRISRDMVGRFFTMLNANIDLCSQVRPNFYNGSEFCLAHAQRNFTNLNKCGKFHACIRNSTILALSRLAIVLFLELTCPPTTHSQI